MSRNARSRADVNSCFKLEGEQATNIIVTERNNIMMVGETHFYFIVSECKLWH